MANLKKVFHSILFLPNNYWNYRKISRQKIKNSHIYKIVRRVDTSKVNSPNYKPYRLSELTECVESIAFNNLTECSHTFVVEFDIHALAILKVNLCILVVAELEQNL